MLAFNLIDLVLGLGTNILRTITTTGCDSCFLVTFLPSCCDCQDGTTLNVLNIEMLALVKCSFTLLYRYCMLLFDLRNTPAKLDVVFYNVTHVAVRHCNVGSVEVLLHITLLGTGYYFSQKRKRTKHDRPTTW